jgi:hypothetical protein
MILADIQSTISLFLTVVMLFFALAGFGIAMIARFFVRRIRDGYREEGGAKGMAKKVATKGAAKLLRRAILKKW